MTLPASSLATPSAPIHRIFDDSAAWGKTSVGRFYGFTLHLVINDEGELLAFKLTPGNIDDRVPVPKLTRHLSGKLFGDKGYISQRLFEELFQRGVELITRLRKTRSPRSCTSSTNSFCASAP